MTDVPQPIEPQPFTVPLEDGDMAGIHWRADGKQPLLFLHATGFCASVYRQMLTHLCGAFDIYALDLRGHGRSALPADSARLKSWHVYAADIGAFLDQQGREDWVLAGHSMGAATAVMAARDRADVAALQLIEPVAMPGWFSAAARTPFWGLLSARIPMVSQAARRRNGWPDRETVKVSYARKPIFKSWRPGVLEDYLEDGLRKDGEGVVLACDPKWEAATFAAHANDFWAAARVATAPMSVYAANHRSSTVLPMARRRFRRLGAIVTEKSGPTHLAPMEEPAELADFLAGKGEFRSP